MRLSHTRIKVLASFGDRPAAPLSGADIGRLTGLASGSLYPILYAFEANGLVESEWEAEEPAALGRPRRRMYRLTSAGEDAAREVAAELAPLARVSGPVREG